MPDIKQQLEAQRRAKDQSRSQSWTGLLQSLSHQPRGVQLLMLLLFVIACGYLSTMLPMGFLGLSLAMTAGVGWPEEICKAAAGTSLLYWMLPVKQESDVLFRRTVLSSYGIAGLGFGALEAIKYFGVYAVEEVGLSIYVVRAIWCVALHGAWTMLVGSIIWPRLPRQGKVFFTDSLTWHLLLVGTIPCAIAHGIYDACCVKESLQMLVVGVLSLGIALLVVARNCGKFEADCGVVA